MVELSTPMSVTQLDDGIYLLNDPVTLKAAKASPLVLRAGTTWQQIGRIEQGNVFDTRDQVVIVNSFDVHEAAIVVADQTAVGFYLKVAESFVQVDPVPIALTNME